MELLPPALQSRSTGRLLLAALGTFTSASPSSTV